MIDLNREIFRRLSTKVKQQVVQNATTEELLKISKDTVLRIIKEVGTGDSKKLRSKFKTFYIDDKDGNNRNSTVSSIYNSKKDEIFLDIYVQGDDTDTTSVCKLSTFLSNYITVECGSITESFSNGYSHTIPANYSKKDRAEVIRVILNTYIKLKDKSRVKQEE